jgi:hypothetical protein
MTDRELMQQALSVLCNNVQPRDGVRDNRHLTPKSHAAIYQQTVDALFDRLAQPEQELMIDCPRCGHCCPKSNQEPVAWMYVNQDGECEQIEYATPPDDPSVTPLYTAPRPWVGLTDKDRQALAAEQHSWEGLCSAVEARLKEKNT